MRFRIGKITSKGIVGIRVISVSVWNPFKKSGFRKSGLMRSFRLPGFLLMIVLTKKHNQAVERDRAKTVLVIGGDVSEIPQKIIKESRE